MQEHHIAIRRTARYYTLGEPGTGELWFVLHGYSQLARRFLRRFEPVAAPARCIVAPEAFNRYYTEYAPGYHAANARIGATWMTKEDRDTDIADYVAYLDQLHQALLAQWQQPPARILLLGFSQGAATAARWAALGQARFHEIVFWGGYVPQDIEWRPDMFGDARVRLVYGRHDGYSPPDRVDPHGEALTAAGVAHEIHWFDGEHAVEPAALTGLLAPS